MDTLDVVDWRRRVTELYAAVRAEQDPAEAHELWRTERDLLMARHPATPILPEHRDALVGLPVAPYDPEWRFEATLDPVAAEDRRALAFDYETGTDGVVGFERVGTVGFPDESRMGGARLDVWRLTSYGGGLFVPVRDALAGADGGTYGGGRYLLDTVKGADLGPGTTPGSLVLDLNFAYNPSCAYDPAWACPLAPAGNVVSVPIPVGELVD